MNNAAIIVSAGHGIRMGTATKKQYMLLAGCPVLWHTMLPFDQCEMVDEIFLVITDGDQATCKKEVLDRCVWQKPVHMIKGGASRQESVFNGLLATDGRFDVVIIHDGVRPFIEAEKIREIITSAYSYGAVVTAIPSHDTVKTVGENEFVQSTLERGTIRLAQTPQAFLFKIIYEAHMAARQERYEGTDDSALVERGKTPVKVVPGSSENIKITTPNDLRLAEAYMKTIQRRRMQ